MKAADQDRNRELAQIHVAKKQLNMADDAYRDLLFTLTRQRSAKDLDAPGRRRVLEHMKKCGFVTSRPDSALAKTPKGLKMLALWGALHKAAKVNSKSEKALRQFIKNETGVDRPEWLDGEQSNRVIEQLKQWLAR